MEEAASWMEGAERCSNIQPETRIMMRLVRHGKLQGFVLGHSEGLVPGQGTAAGQARE